MSTNESADGLLKMQHQLQSRSLSTFVIENVFFSLGEPSTIIGNFLALFIVLRNRNLRRAIPNMLIVSLSASGLLNGLTVVPISHTALAASEWLFDNAFCQFEGFMVLFTGTSSLLTIALMSVSRFYSVVKNNLYRRYFTFKRTLIMISVMWFLGFTAPLMFLLIGHRFIFIPAKVLCYVPIEKDWFLILLAVVYVGWPSLVVLFCYCQIFRTVRRHNATVFTSSSGVNIQGTSNPNIQRASGPNIQRASGPNIQRASGTNIHEVNITRMMFAILVCFCFCWLPVLLIELVDIIRKRWSFPRAVYVLFTFLPGLSNMLNPIIYGVMNTTLRKELIKCLRLENRPNGVRPIQ